MMGAQDSNEERGWNDDRQVLRQINAKVLFQEKSMAA
jgi:hypothetical protein